MPFGGGGLKKAFEISFPLPGLPVSPSISSQNGLVPTGPITKSMFALAVAGILGTVIGAYYYLRIVKVMYLDEPAEPYARTREPVQGALVLLAAIVVSPLGYLLIGPLGALTDRAAGSIF